MEYTTSCVSAQVDWITATEKAQQPREAMRELGNRLLYYESAADNDLRPFASHGMTGQMCGHVALAERHDITFLQISSDTAAAYWKAVAEICQHFTRIDCQVTVRYNPRADDVARHARREYLKHERAGHRRQRSLLMIGDDHADTFQIGRHSSETMARIYNKAKQSTDAIWSQCWRFEVQFRGERACTVAKALRGAVNHHAVCASIVRDYLVQRGISAPWKEAEMYQLESGLQHSSDLSATLRWLRTQVRPTIERLIDGGRAHAALAALGLLDLVEASGVTVASDVNASHRSDVFPDCR